MKKSQQPLVSMITYCYNGERFVHKYFEAILAQSYQNIELIFFNNGSEDKTGKITEEYKRKLEARGIQVQLIHFEKNQNTCELKQKGFELMHGEYFFGCDSDDLIHPTYIEEMAGYLINHPEKGIVFCALDVIQEETGEKIGTERRIPQTTSRGAFVDMLYARNTIFTAISYMMSREQYLRINGNFDFYISRYGENYQLQLPFLYYDLQGYIDKPLGDYTVRGDSYSGQLKRDYAKQVDSYKGQEITILETLKRINEEETKPYQIIAKKRLRRDRFYASLRLNDAALRQTCYEELREVGGLETKERLVYTFRPIYLMLRA